MTTLLLMSMTTAAVLLLGDLVLCNCKLCTFVEGGRYEVSDENVCSFVDGLLITAPSVDRCVNCTQINMSGNNITNLYKEDLELHPDLITLWASRNWITTLIPEAFSTVPYLYAVFLDHNRIAHLPLDSFLQNSRLTRAYFSHNPLVLPRTGPFIRSISINILDVSSCNLTSIPSDCFTGMPNLTHLNLADNQLTTLRGDAFRLLKGLTFMNVSLNGIANLKFAKNLTLSSLSAENIPLTVTATDSHLLRLRQLTLSDSVCCCEVCLSGVLKMSGKAWFNRCMECLVVIPQTTPSTVTMLPETSTLQRGRTRSEMSTTASDDVFVAGNQGIGAVMAGKSAGGNLIIIVIVLSVLLTLIFIFAFVYLLICWTAKSRAVPCHPGYHECRPYSRQLPRRLSNTSSGQCTYQGTCCHSIVVTDLDAPEGTYMQTTNHIYETVDDDREA